MEDEAFWQDIVQLRHGLHAHPELSGEEMWTKERLEEFISSRTRLEIQDHGSWFSARFCPQHPDGAPPVAFRADMDALPLPEAIDLPYGSVVPGVSHKCGHDGHSAALAALACLLEDDVAITRPVCLVFQPAEETGKGGRACADFVRDAGAGEVYAFHNLSGYPEGAVMVRDGLAQPASSGLAISFEGVPAHAGTPELGRNPAAALGRLAVAAERLEQEESPSRKLRFATVVGIHEGKRDFGISPGRGEILFTLRSGDEEDLAAMQDALVGQAEALAKRYGLKMSSRIEDPFPATVNDPVCAARARRAAEEIGAALVPMPEPWRPSEDFGWYTKAVPGAMLYIGNGETWPHPHQLEYDFNDRILPVAARLFLRLAEGDTR